MDAFQWIDANLNPRIQDEGSFLYEGMDSQSGRSLPLIYEPFDASKREHWADRGAAFDYAASTGGGRLLDFGPGDGWPSLIVAPYVDEVIGVDATRDLVDVCRANADALEIENASFRLIEPDGHLPFDDASFDGVMASSSVEQTANPKATLAEFCRVLKPGGRLRMYYESLEGYRGAERQGWLMGLDDGTSFLYLSEYYVDDERARHVRLHFPWDAAVVAGHFGIPTGAIDFARITPEALAEHADAILDTRGCRLTHACGATLVRWLKEVGFAEAHGTHGGRVLAANLFDSMPTAQRPSTLEGVDTLVRPVVEAGVKLAAPIGLNPMLTAVK